MPVKKTKAKVKEKTKIRKAKKKVGRKPLEITRSEQIGVKVTKEAIKKLEDFRVKHKISKTVILERLINNLHKVKDLVIKE